MRNYSKMSLEVGSTWYLFFFFLPHKNELQGFHSSNIMLVYPQYKYINGTQNTENTLIINATYTGQEENRFHEQT